MQKLRVASFSVSVDGFGAGPDQSMDNPLGVGGAELHQWFYHTKTFRQNVLGKNDGKSGIDNDFAEKGFENIGAWILGRNMFSPYRRQPNLDWKGWWGENPPYHVPVFVLKNHKRDTLEMEGGTTFHFVTDGIHAARERAFDSANGKDVRVGGGVNTIRQYLTAQLLDELHLVVSLVIMGKGENLFADLDLKTLGYKCTESTPGDKGMHVIIKKQL